MGRSAENWREGAVNLDFGQEPAKLARKQSSVRVGRGLEEVENLLDYWKSCDQ